VQPEVTQYPPLTGNEGFSFCLFSFFSVFFFSIFFHINLIMFDIFFHKPCSTSNNTTFCTKVVGSTGFPKSLTTSIMLCPEHRYVVVVLPQPLLLLVLLLVLLLSV
jgi:hypothetical protein